MINPSTLPRRRSAGLRSRERGIVLFIALIAMVVMSFAGVALVRSVDTSTSVTKNLVFRQASIPVINNSVEVAMGALFKNPTITNRDADDIAHNYFASLQPNEHSNAVPDVLWGAYPPAGYLSKGLPVLAADSAGNEARFVIERVCVAAGSPSLGNCDLLAPKQSLGKTSMKLKGPTILPLPFYRVSVRVDGPSNTVTHAQAMIR